VEVHQELLEYHQLQVEQEVEEQVNIMLMEILAQQTLEEVEEGLITPCLLEPEVLEVAE
jgi:hypothetical protein